MEVGAEAAVGYELTPGLKISGAVRKSLLTNLTDNERRSNSSLPRVHSDWPLYDFAGQSGHIHELTLSYVKNLGPGLYGRSHVGLLEPFFAGVGAEILYKPAQWPIGIGLDVHRVRKRDYDMRFDLLNYETTVGHLSLYYDAGGMFDVEVNAGRYLARDWVRQQQFLENLVAVGRLAATQHSPTYPSILLAKGPLTRLST